MMKKWMIALALVSPRLFGQVVLPPWPPVFPPPALVVKDVGPMEVRSVEVKASVRGLLATVESTYVFHNPNNRVFEGELTFPLPDRGIVCGYAIDIGGALVDGVVVPKEEARIAFEKEVRRGVDPGLVEQVKGNLYKTRVYPIPANGTRTVRVVYNAPLAMTDRGAALRLPMARAKLASRTIEIEVATPGAEPPVLEGLGDRRFEAAEQLWRVRDEATDAVPGEDILVAIPRLPDAFDLYEKDPRGDLWIASARRLPSTEAPNPVAGKVDVYWDASGSHRPSEGEFKALEAILGLAGKGTRLRLRLFRDVPEPFRELPSAKDLLAAVRSLDAYDGATAFEGLYEGIDREALSVFFTDGLETVRDASKKDVFPEGRLVAVVSTPEADTAFLRGLTGNRLLKLAEVASNGVAQAFCRLFVPREGGEQAAAAEEPVSISEGPFELVVGRVEKVPAVPVPKGMTLARAWASARMEELAVDPAGNEDAMLGLGRRYGVVGPKTSLLVLDSLSQWLRYEIEPPASQPKLREQWLVAMKDRRPDESPEEKVLRHRERLARLWKKRLTWWERDFTKDPLPVPPPRKPAVAGGAAAPANDAAPARVEAPMAVVAEACLAADEAPAAVCRNGILPADVEAGAAAPSISVKAWNPDTPYLKALDKVATNDLYAAYLARRKTFAESPAFYLDCAGRFFEAGQRDLAVRILSNLLEMELENASLTRVLAWRLRQAGEYDLAIDQLRRAVGLRPEDGQGVRDLALALSERGKRLFAQGKGVAAKADLEEALALYVRAAFTPWDRAADTLGLFALEEFNALRAWIDASPEKSWTKGKPVVPGLDAEFRKAISTDVRIIMEWDSDNVDIDLHVVEPNGEEAYYAHNRTRRGGLVSRDVTDGFGPEEYMIRVAPKGGYEVFTHYFASHEQMLYGPATVTATVFTNWGRTNEVSKTLSIRLDKPRDKVPLGEISFR